MRLKHKFNAKKCEADNKKFGSKLERNYYNRLKLLQNSGEILFFLRQVPIDLPGNVTYRIDFIEFWAPKDDDQGEVIFTEVKGYMTKDALIKIKQAQDILGIEINIVSK